MMHFAGRRPKPRLSACTIEALEGRRLLSASDISNFGGGSGALSVPLVPLDTALQADGKFVIVGYTGKLTSMRSAIMRYNADGTPDSTFNGGQAVIFDVAGIDDAQVYVSGHSFASGVVVDASGNIIVCGATGVSGSVTMGAGANSHAYVERFQPDGTLDTSFHSTILGWDAEQATGVAIDPATGDVLVSTNFYNYQNNPANFSAPVLGFNPVNGTRDNSFGIFPGYTNLVIPTGGDITGERIAVAPDGSFVEPGSVRYNSTTSDWNFAVDEYAADGKSYHYFNYPFGNGSTDIVKCAAIQPDGKIILGGSSNGQFALVRLNPASGGSEMSVDTTFGNNGQVVTAVGSNAEIHHLLVQPDGQIVASGIDSNGTGILAAYQSNGSLDTTFGVNGTLTFAGAAPALARSAGQATPNIDVFGGDPILPGKNPFGGKLPVATPGQGVKQAYLDKRAPLAYLTATLQTPSASGGNTYNLQVTFTDNQGIDRRTLSARDVSIQLPGGGWATGQLLTSISFFGPSPTSLNLSYQFTLPSEGGLLTGGAYGVWLTKKSLSDASGNVAAAKLLGSFTVNGGSSIDSTPPTVTLSARNMYTAARYYYFTVHYHDDGGVDLASIDGGDVSMYRKGFGTLAAVVSSVAGGGTDVDVTYGVRLKGAGWTAVDDGAFSLLLNSAQIRDLSINYAAAQTLGAISVRIPAAASPAFVRATPDDVLVGALTSNAFDADARPVGWLFSDQRLF